MKPVSFEYHAPKTLQEALEIKHQFGDDVKPLAGGQSLIPAMNFRVIQPTILLDLNGIENLKNVSGKKNGEINIGAMTTQAFVGSDLDVEKYQPLIHEVIPHIAHSQIRNRGTFGGSLAHADPASELPVVATALNAKFKAENIDGERWIPVDEFIETMFTVSLKEDELLTEISFPAFPKNTGWSFLEIGRRHGDYAMAGVAGIVTLDEEGNCQSSKLVYLNVGEKAMVASEAGKMLIGQSVSEGIINEVAEHASSKEITPFGNVHATAEYQQHLSKVLTKRVLKIANQRALALLGISGEGLQ